jgi:AcrR family transcriptional regulator
VYRYFDTRQALRAAYVQREANHVAAGVSAALAGVDDPRERVVEGVLLAVSAVRDRPELAAWFSAEATAIATDHAGSSAAIDGLATGFVGEAVADDVERRRCAGWLVRVIVSLLTMPGASPEEERALVERFVAPVITIAPPAEGQTTA